ncbi:unnamed protein product [Symbiodinium sp. KB8]|nr:unnamed protein product [Symbiodinium sp. KB8]
MIGAGPCLAYAPPGARLSQKQLGWLEFEGRAGHFVCRHAAGAKAVRTVEVAVQVRKDSLLSTLAIGTAFLQAVSLSIIRTSHYCQRDMCMDICTIMQQLPTDGGLMATNLALHLDKPAHPVDGFFGTLCWLARHRANLAAQEAAASRAAAELLAEEDKALRAKKKKTLTSTRTKSCRWGNRSTATKDQQDLQDCPSKSDSSNDECAATEARSLPTGFHEDFSERVSSLRHNFPFFDDDILCEHLMQAESNMEQAVLSLSKKEFEPAVAFVVLEPADIPLNQRTCERRGAPKQVYGNVIARTDHSRLPLYCFVVLVMQSNSARCKVGSIARPIPEDRFRLMGDEKGHFWKKKARVPEVGDVVEMQFFEEDNTNYLGLGSYPHKNEDLLCTSLLLKSRSLLAKNVSALGALGLVAVDDVETIWPWKSGLSKFPSVQPGKHIWFVHATKSSLPSVIILRLNHAGTLNFKYRSDASDKISLDFKAGRKHLRDLPVTAAGFNSPPHVLNECFKLRAQEIDHLLVLGLARAERRGPEGYNRLPECSEALQRQLDVESFAEYCQLLVIGILEVPKAGQTFSSPPPPTGGPSKTSPIPDTMPHAYTYFPDAPGNHAKQSKPFQYPQASQDPKAQELSAAESLQRRGLACAWMPTLEASAAARRAS